MYSKKDKRRLYWLIDQYLLNEIDNNTFCDDFHDTLVNEMYYEGLTTNEDMAFIELLDTAQRFSEYEEDHKLWNGFVTEEQLKQKIIETKEKLKNEKN